ncbi:hypothetical protein Ate02nite_08800 [Paractinoplanes tereljensis]|uniref:Uncharacterized protein n=1 Tax=Paractinoplanes tereljensis TaxID=571912 RepID=A0A919NHC2_9ACTN|nr:hypothetical protein Ate02nite_08800 [Actinoplanes tereljensis]
MQGQGHVTQLGEGQDVGQQLAGEDHAAGAQEGDHSHGGIVGAYAKSAQDELVYRLETNYIDCSFDQYRLRGP